MKTIEINISKLVRAELNIDEQNQLICAEFTFENSALAMNFSMILGEMLKRYSTGTAAFENNTWQLVIEFSVSDDWEDIIYETIRAINFFNETEIEEQCTKAN